MASLKEIKGRISSVEGTLKITSAMKMVASAKLHKAQQAIEGMLPYDRLLHRMMSRMLMGCTEINSPFSHPHAEVKRVAVVCVASNSSLCGGYNSNVIRHTTQVLQQYQQQLTADAIDCYVLGRKLAQSLGKLQGFNLIQDYVECSTLEKVEWVYTLTRRLVEC